MFITVKCFFSVFNGLLQSNLARYMDWPYLAGHDDVTTTRSHNNGFSSFSTYSNLSCQVGRPRCTNHNLLLTVTSPLLDPTTLINASTFYKTCKNKTWLVCRPACTEPILKMMITIVIEITIVRSHSQ